MKHAPQRRRIKPVPLQAWQAGSMRKQTMLLHHQLSVEVIGAAVKTCVFACGLLALVGSLSALGAEHELRQRSEQGPQGAPANRGKQAASDQSATDDHLTALDQVSVVGRGQRRQVQRIDIAEAGRSPPGSSPLKLLETRPGVNLQSSDPFASYEWSTRISVRGFAQQKLAFSLDGIPLGDMSYSNHNGLHLSRAVISENLQALELAQGSSALDAPASHALGGAINAYSAEPLRQRQVRIDLNAGSQGSARRYLRFDSGPLSGLDLMLSAVDQDGEKWKGQGDQRQRQFNGKARWGVGESEWTAFLATSQRRENDYMDLSLDSQRRLGWDWDYYAPDWQRAIDAANGIYRGQVQTLDDAYYRGRGLRNDQLGYLAADWGDGERAYQLKFYRHSSRGQGHWVTPYTPSDEVPLSLRTTDYDIQRNGLLPRFDWAGDRHQLSLGLWLERNRHDLRRDFYRLQRDAPPDQMRFYSNPDQQVFAQDFRIDTRQLFIRDQWQLLDQRLDLEWGFKASDVQIRARTPLGDRAAGRLRSRDLFQPQFSARYSLAGQQEVFAAYHESSASFSAGIGGPFAASQQAFDTLRDALKPERARNIELGWRMRRSAWETSLVAYLSRFSDRLLAIARCTGIVGCPIGFANVGDVKTEGLELALGWQPDSAWRGYFSASYNDSRYQNDYLDGDRRIPSAGKQVVDSPRWLFAGRLQWQRGIAQLGITSKYTGERYYSYSNDAGVASRSLTDLDISLQPAISSRFDLRLRFQLSNVFNKRYFSTIDSNGFVAFDPGGQHYSLHAGSPRQWFFSAELRF